jgi:DNA repair exonuclease SbcCD nuclease subunit
VAKYLLINDVHLSDRPPSSCTDTYLDDLFDLLGQVVVLARVQQVSALVIAGDLFHCKAPSRVSHRMMIRLVKWIRSAPCPVAVVAGNHDLQHDRVESLDETQPLGMLVKSDLVRLLDGWDPDFPLYGVPWQQEWTDEAVNTALAAFRGPKGNALVVTHAPLYPPGLELEYEFYPAPKFAEAMGGTGYCYYGHVHERHGIWLTEPASTFLDGGSSQVTFCNPGALSRGSLHEHNLTRVPACVVWDSDTGQFTEIPLNARPPEEVFRLKEAREVTDMRGRLDEFLAAIGSTTLEGVSVESVIEHIRSLGLPEADTALAIDLLMEAANDHS